MIPTVGAQHRVPLAWMLSIALLTILLEATARGAEPPTLPRAVPPEKVVVHDSENLALLEALNREYAALATRCAAWNARAKTFNDRYGGRDLDADSPDAAAGSAEQAWLAREMEAYDVARRAFAKHRADLVIDYEQYIPAISALARTLDFPAAKLDSLNATLAHIAREDDPDTEGKRVLAIWNDIRARDADPGFMREARDSGVGPVLMPAAGRQSFEDCTLFALASATGQPYGVVAARANKLLEDATWRGAADRANPQHVLETEGLNAGEVILLAELFGKSEAVTSGDFPRKLMEGSPILVGLVMAHEDAAGNVHQGLHQAVLTKTFMHDHQTWYEMRDSNQDPGQRRYVSDRELHALLSENGIVFSHDTTQIPRIPSLEP